MDIVVSVVATSLTLIGGLACVVDPARWPKRVPAGKIGVPAKLFHRGIGALTVSGAALQGILLLTPDAGSRVSLGVLAASGIVFALQAYDLILNSDLPESLAHPPGADKLPVSGFHKAVVAVAFAIVALSLASVAGAVSPTLCLKVWSVYTFLRGLVLAGMNTPEKTRAIVLQAMFPNFEDVSDALGLQALAWAAPRLGYMFLCLSAQAAILLWAPASWACMFFIGCFCVCIR